MSRGYEHSADDSHEAWSFTDIHELLDRKNGEHFDDSWEIQRAVYETPEDEMTGLQRAVLGATASREELGKQLLFNQKLQHAKGGPILLAKLGNNYDGNADTYIEGYIGEIAGPLEGELRQPGFGRLYAPLVNRVVSWPNLKNLSTSRPEEPIWMPVRNFHFPNECERLKDGSSYSVHEEYDLILIGDECAQGQNFLTFRDQFAEFIGITNPRAMEDIRNS